MAKVSELAETKNRSYDCSGEIFRLKEKVELDQEVRPPHKF